MPRSVKKKKKKKSKKESEQEVKDRLTILLKFVEEISSLSSHLSKGEQLELATSTSKKKDSAANRLILWESSLEKAKSLKTHDGQIAVRYGGDDMAWFKIRRPVETSSNAAKIATECYANLFEVRQEALRQGKGLQLTIGCGLVRWRVNKKTIEHPLVMIPAEVTLDEDGAFRITAAAASRASLFLFPGVIAAAPALSELDRCMNDYGFYVSPPQPSDRDAWEPVLMRAAHCLHSKGKYFRGVPPGIKTKAGAPTAEPKIYNTFVLFTRDHAGGTTASTVAKDASALAESLQVSKSIPRAIGRLAGVYDLDGMSEGPRYSYDDDDDDDDDDTGFSSRSSLCSRIFGTGTSIERSKNGKEKSMLYFGLASNAEQRTTVKLLEKHGCCTLLGPPGTGKTQTIANVICHYLAHGRRVLVTSKGVPATEVLRKKLPAGIRELCVALGGGDSNSFRTLEGAVEHIANHVAAASPKKLQKEADRLRERFRAIEKELVATERAETEFAAMYFSNSDNSVKRGDLRKILNEEHLSLLGVQTTSTIGQLADAVASILDHDDEEESLPRRAYFLEDVKIDPLQAPPSASIVDELRVLRAESIDALKFETEFRKCRIPTVDAVSTEELRHLIRDLRSRSETMTLIGKGKIPAIVDVSAGRELYRKMLKIKDCMIPLSQEERSFRSTSSSKKNKGNNNKPFFAWQLLRHTDNYRIAQSLLNVTVLFEELQRKWRGIARVGSVYIPKVLEQLCNMPLSSELKLKRNMGNEYFDRAILGEANEFASEIKWRAHPEQQSFLGNFMRRQPSQTLLAELGSILVEDSIPVSSREYKVVELWIVLISCEARLREEWAKLRIVATSLPSFPKETLSSRKKRRFEDEPELLEFIHNMERTVSLCSAAMDVSSGLGDVAARACGRPLSFLNVLGLGLEACDDEISKLRQALSVSSGDQIKSSSLDEDEDSRLGEALRRKNTMIKELESSVRFASDSPMLNLRNATESLGDLSVGTESQVKRWINARQRVRNGLNGMQSLDKLRKVSRSVFGKRGWSKHLTEVSLDDETEDEEFRDPIPRDARVLYAAIAARDAIRSAGDRRRVRERGDKRVIHRLMEQREACVKLLVAAVAKYEIRKAMTPERCAGLLRFLSAVAVAGSASGDGLRAQRHRADLAASVLECSSTVPCWIAPVWRVSQCLPSQVASFDLVIIDEASQSDVTALTALLRGKRILVVGDQKQVSPVAVGIKETSIRDLKSRLLASRHPYVEQILPGRSIFDLASTCFADSRVALSQHFRCVPQCIALSNSLFYHSRLQPRRLPYKSQRLSPAIVDVYVPNGKKRGKINTIEAEALVAYLQEELEEGGELCKRNASVGIISLMGKEQSRVIRKLLLQCLTDEQLSRHRIVVGDPSSLQGDERSVILLSMVASKGSCPTQTGRMYEQRFNVALSRARDRMVLFRSVRSADVPSRQDLKVHTISFFSSKKEQIQVLNRTPSSNLNLFTDSTVEGQVLNFLSEEGYSFDTSCTIAGSLAVIEDMSRDSRLVICVDGGGGRTLSNWKRSMKEQRSLERRGWVFFRFWHGDWIVNRNAIKASIRRACIGAGVMKRDRMDIVEVKEDDAEVVVSSSKKAKRIRKTKPKLLFKTTSAKKKTPAKKKKAVAKKKKTTAKKKKKTTTTTTSNSSSGSKKRKAPAKKKKRPVKKKKTTTKRKKKKDEDEWIPSSDDDY